MRALPWLVRYLPLVVGIARDVVIVVQAVNHYLLTPDATKKEAAIRLTITKLHERLVFPTTLDAQLASVLGWVIELALKLSKRRHTESAWKEPTIGGEAPEDTGLLPQQLPQHAPKLSILRDVKDVDRYWQQARDEFAAIERKNASKE